MPNNCLSVLYKRIIQVENKNVGGHKHTIAPPQSKKWGDMPPLPPPPPPPASYASVYSSSAVLTHLRAFLGPLSPPSP